MSTQPGCMAWRRRRSRRAAAPIPGSAPPGPSWPARTPSRPGNARRVAAGWRSEALGVHPARGDGDHPRGGGGKQRGHEQGRQQEWRGSTCPRIVSSVPAPSVRNSGWMTPALWMSSSSLAIGGAEPAGEGADRIEVLKIGQAVADAPAAGRCRDCVPGTLRPAAIAGQEMDRRAPPCERNGRRVADPGRRASYDDGPPVGRGVVIRGVSGSRADRTASASGRNPGPRRPLVRRPPPARSGSRSAPRPRRRPAGRDRCARWRRDPRTRRAPRQGLGKPGGRALCTARNLAAGRGRAPAVCPAAAPRCHS